MWTKVFQALSYTRHCQKVKILDLVLMLLREQIQGANKDRWYKLGKSRSKCSGKVIDRKDQEEKKERKEKKEKRKKKA